MPHTHNIICYLLLLVCPYWVYHDILQYGLVSYTPLHLQTRQLSINLPPINISYTLPCIGWSCYYN